MTISGGVPVHNHSGASQGGATLSAHVPSGRISFFGYSAQPATASDWLECNGQNVSRATFANLFAAIGVTWGAGDGATTFTLPDFRRRVPVGMGGAGTGALGNAVGNTGGGETTESHAHGGANDFIVNNTAGAISGGAAVGIIQAMNARTYGTGTHGVIQPSAVCGFWIKT